MSIFNKVSTPVKVLRSFFFLMALVSALIYFFPMTGYAQEETSEATDTPQRDEQPDATEDIPQIEEQPEEKIVFSQNIYHQHTGGSGGGGCYSVQRTGSKKTTEKCSGTMVYYASYDKTQCNKCGAGYNGDQSGRKCWHEKTTTVSYTYYDLGCNKGTDTQVGSLSVEKSTDKWVRNLSLIGSYEADGGMGVSPQPYIWNGGRATENNIFEVQESGVYTLQLNADANANTGAAVIRMEVRNVDVTAPVIHAHALEPEFDWTKEGVLVTITDVVDLQPDGSEGCGLHEMPYSYDGGENWTAENSFLYMQNGTHSILVRDILENQSSYEVSFSNVDCSPPTIDAVDYDRTKNIRDTVVTVTARDIQPDGSEGIGLHEEAYSYDGGQTWTKDNTLPVNKNGTISIVVRDALGNEVSWEEVITNIDCTGPEIIWELDPESWTNKNVELTLKARDLNEDGSEGIGLGDAWYSLDGGNTWSDKEEREYDKNQTLTVIARDKNNNRTSQIIKIRQIDKELPWVSLSMEVMGAGRDMQVKLTAQAWDEYSGLHDEAYSWDKGVTYGTDSTKIVTENGTYQITVRDKAGNWRYDIVEVDVFPIIEFPVIVKEKAVSETVVEPEEIVEETATEKETVEVKMQERIQEPETGVMQTIEEEKGFLDAIAAISIALLAVGLVAFLLLLLMNTITIYAEDLNGEMQYMGRLWILKKEERMEVKVSYMLLEKCVTTHFLFRLSPLFVLSHKEKDICFLFPEDICLIKQAEREIEISLL